MQQAWQANNAESDRTQSKSCAARARFPSFSRGKRYNAENGAASIALKIAIKRIHRWTIFRVADKRASFNFLRKTYRDRLVPRRRRRRVITRGAGTRAERKGVYEKLRVGKRQ